MEHFVEVVKGREGETAGLHSPAQRLPECSDAGKRSDVVKRTVCGCATAAQKMASVALDVERKRGRDQRGYCGDGQRAPVPASLSAPKY